MSCESSIRCAVVLLLVAACAPADSTPEPVAADSVLLDPDPVAQPWTDSPALPPSATAVLDQRFPGWTRAVHDTLSDMSCGAPAIDDNDVQVSADFDGDSAPDYAVNVQHDGQSHLVMLLAKGQSWELVDLEESITTGVYLYVAKEGTPYHDHETDEESVYPLDSLVLTYCQKAASAWIYEDGRFRVVIVSD